MSEQRETTSNVESKSARLCRKLKFWKKKGKKDDTGAREEAAKRRQKEVEMDEHKITLEELAERLNTNYETGLSEAQAIQVREKEGLNALTPPQATPEWVKFLHHTFSGFGILLTIGGVLCFIIWLIDTSTNDNLWLAITLFLVVLISGSLSYYQDRASSKVMESFKNMCPSVTTVIRDGLKKQINAEELVRGDIVEVKGGDRVPADVRILSSTMFKVDNSSLTGESEPLNRNADCTHENPLETKNLAFYSTYAVEGTAKCVVIKTGDHTIIGGIANLTMGMKVGDTPIAKEINYFIRVITSVAIFYGAVMFIICFAYGYSFLNSILFFIGIVIANVPEGMLIEVTVLFALTAKRMASKNCLVRKLQAVETLGSTSVICTDKTGTLTQNRMTVAHLWYDGELHDADMSQDHFTYRGPADLSYTAKPDDDFAALAQVAALCNRAEFKPDQKEVPVLRRECIGDASETALLKYVQIAVSNVDDYRRRNPKIVEIPFNSTNKYQVSVHLLERKDRGAFLVVMKGAPERILDRCQFYMQQGHTRMIDQNFKDLFDYAYLQMGSMGERVLGFCDLILPEDEYPPGFEFSTDPVNFPLEGFRFLGLMSMIDPPRPGVPDAVTMVTGDHPITAQAIAKSVGIFTAETAEEVAERLHIPLEEVDPELVHSCIIHGTELKDMSVEDVSEILQRYKEIVFARTSPQQKLLIVQAYQSLGNYVAVTGDGVNDSPALKQADIGIAMGIAGSDVSKQVADMILMDDNFASIVTGVEEGRLIFDNLKKAITYVMITNIPEIFPFILIVVFNIPLALSTVAILCICLGTDIWPAIALAYEKAESDIMHRKPRDPKNSRLINDRLLSYVYGQMGIIETVGSYFTYFVVFGECGFWPRILFGIRDDWDNAAINAVEDSYGQEWTYVQRKFLEQTVQSAYFVSNVIIQWANVIVCKTRRNSLVQQGMGNWWLNSGLVFETVLAFFLLTCPGLDDALKLRSLKFWWWWPALPFAIFTFCFDESRKYFIRRYPGSWVEHEWNF
uniref:Sodium/potassium-transporting ATPase subunit alpha n=2 Tax=Romanomermis culicivorax TaxID=13658 RepID=A0A915LBR9_ROMCU